jgi:hypothetical protein
MIARKGRVPVVLLFVLACSGLAVGCGGGSPSQVLGYGSIAVTSISGPASGSAPTALTITGGDFSQLVGTSCTVRFRATSGTPFHGGTSAEAEVTGTITSPTTIDVTSPGAVICGSASIMAYVTVLLPSGVSGTSATPIAVFNAPTLGSLGGGGMFPAAIPTAYTITGTGFGPVGGTVQVTWSSMASIFEGGAATSTQTSATVDSATMISGLSPETAVCGVPSVGAFITQIEFPGGVCTPTGTSLAVTFVAPTATAVTNASGAAPHSGNPEFAAALPEPLTVTGTGFGPVGGTAKVTFTHPGGTLVFGGNPGASATATVDGTIVSSTSITAPASPAAFVCGNASEGVDVTVSLPGGSCTIPPGVPVTFFAPTITGTANLSGRALIQGTWQFFGHIPESMQVSGTDFGPIGGSAFVTFTDVSGALPYTPPGGGPNVAASQPVLATITSRTTLQLTSPVGNYATPAGPNAGSACFHVATNTAVTCTLQGGSCTPAPYTSAVLFTGVIHTGVGPTVVVSTVPLGQTTMPSITVTGLGFWPVGGQATITFDDTGGVPTPFNGAATISVQGTILSETQISAELPVLDTPRLTADQPAQITVTLAGGTSARCTNALTFTAPPTITSLTNARAPFQQGAPAASVADTWLACMPTDTTITGTGFRTGITELLYATAGGPTHPIGTGTLGTLPEPTATAPGAGTPRTLTVPTTLEGASPTDDTLTSDTGVTLRVVNPDGQWHQRTGLTWALTGALPNTNVTQDAGTNAEMNVAVNPHNPLNACVFSHDGSGVFLDIRHSYTFDGGNTWTTTTIGSATATYPDGLGAAYTFRFDPVCGFDGFGNYWVVYGAGDGSRDGAGGTPYLVMAARSSDGGQTFDSFTVLPWQRSGNGDGSDRWVMATGKNGAVAGRQCLYVAGMDLNGRPDVVVTGLSIAAGAGPNGEGGAVSFLATPSGLGYEIVNDAGPIVGSTYPVGHLQHPAVSVGPNGEVYVSWVDFDLSAGTKAIPFSADIFVDADLNGLDDPTPIADFGTDVIAKSGILLPFSSPITPQASRGYSPIPMHRVIRAGPNAGRIVMTYTDMNAAGDTDVFTIYSDSDGATWSAPALVHSPDPTDQFHPWLDTDPVTGNVYVTWYDPRNGGGASVQRFSAASSNGATWSLALLLSQGTSTGDGGNDYLEYNGVSVFDGCVYACWADRSNYTGDAPDGSMQAYVSVYMQKP